MFATAVVAGSGVATHVTDGDESPIYERYDGRRGATPEGRERVVEAMDRTLAGDQREEIDDAFLALFSKDPRTVPPPSPPPTSAPPQTDTAAAEPEVEPDESDAAVAQQSNPAAEGDDATGSTPRRALEIESPPRRDRPTLFNM